LAQGSELAQALRLLDTLEQQVAPLPSSDDEDPPDVDGKRGSWRESQQLQQ